MPTYLNFFVNRENCPCCETCKECVSFQKILHLKNAGLVIYRHSNRIDEVNKTTGLLKSCKNTRDDIFIVHNTKDIQIKANDCISETDQGISCARCRELVQRAKKYLRNVPPIDKKDIISICDHCKQNINKERSLNLCYKRHEILKKYHAEEIKHITAKEQIKTWLTISVNNFESVATDKNMNKSLKCRSLSELYLDKICDTAVKAGRHLEVRPMLQKGASMTESGHSIDNDTKSESALKFSHPEYIKSKSVLIRADSLLKIESYVSPSVITYDMSLFVESPIKHEKYLRPTTAQIMKGILQKGTESTHKIKSKIGQSLSKLQNYYSDEEIFLSDASLKDHEIDKNFRYVFPKGISDKVAPLRRVKTSAELITDTQEMFRQRVMDEQKNFQAQRKILPTRKLRTGEKGTIASDDQDSSKKIKKKESEESAKIKKVKSGEKGEKTKKEKPEDDSEKNKESNVSKSDKEQIQKDQKQKKESELRTTDKTDQIRKEKDEKLRVVEDKKKEQERLKKQKEQKQHEKQEQLRKEKELKQKLKEAQQKMKEEKEKNKKYDKAQAEPKQKTESISINIKNQQKYEHDKNKMEEDRNRKETKTEKANTDKEQIQKDQKQKKEFESHTKDKEKEEKHSEKKEQPRKEKELMQKLKEAEKNIKLDKAQAEPKGKPESINIKKQQNEEHDQNKKEEDRKRKEEAERKLKALEETKTEKTNGHEKPKVNKTQEEPTIKELQIKQIKMRMTSPDDLILQLVKLRQSIRSKEGERPKRLAEHHIIPPIKVNEHKKVHKNKKVKNYAMSLDSDLELDVENIATVEPTLEATDIIVGDKIFKCKHPLREKIQSEETLPILYKSLFNEDTAIAQVKECTENFTNLKEHKPSLVSHKYGEQEVPKGIIRYALSDRSFIDKGWTMLPTEKVVRKMNVYRMRPAHPKFDWFERNKNKRLMLYDTGEKLAEFDDNGRGRWFYRNGRIALDYYDAEEMNAQQRFVIYGSGEPDERGRHQPIAILGTFDYLGNGVVFDHTGKIRLKYNQTEGVVLDRNIGPVSHWKWHTLNDPPVLQQVMIDTQMAHKDPEIVKLGGPGDDKVRPDNEEMLAIEFDNFIKEKSKKLSQKFKPFQIRTKALKINEKFSLKVLDQANIYLIFRDGTTNIKLNIGMILDHQEIVDTDTAEVGEVSNNLERFPARTDSLAGLQRSVAYAQRVERMRVEREHRLRHPEPCSSADKLTSAASRPLKPKLRAVASTSTVAKEDCICNCRKRSTCDVYYDTRFV